MFAIPLLLLLLFLPQSLPMFLLIVGGTTVLTILGAYLGHTLIPPMRYPVH